MAWKTADTLQNPAATAQAVVVKQLKRGVRLPTPEASLCRDTFEIVVKKVSPVNRSLTDRHPSGQILLQSLTPSEGNVPDGRPRQ